EIIGAEILERVDAGPFSPADAVDGRLGAATAAPGYGDARDRGLRRHGDVNLIDPGVTGVDIVERRVAVADPAVGDEGGVGAVEPVRHAHRPQRRSATPDEV